MNLKFSFVIPVYNRPEEIKELLNSFLEMNTDVDFDIVIVEDGSSLTSEEIIKYFKSKLDISYFFKDNSGPGDSRNYGMQRAKGNYFIILDSDCILPRHYLAEVKNALEIDYVDCFGGPDAAHTSFNNLQKAINFAMTSFLTTGGIRGGKNSLDEFQPRSFNMGISKEAFNASGGFGRIHPGEDPDLSIRLKKLGFKTKLIPDAFIYHKRRISWRKFFNQVYRFGLARPVLNNWYPSTRKLTYWFPTVFCFGLLISGLLYFFNIEWPLFFFMLYFILVFISSLISSQSIGVAILSLVAICIQFFGYGFGFLKATTALQIFKKEPEEQFPELFFKSK